MDQIYKGYKTPIEPPVTETVTPAQHSRVTQDIIEALAGNECFVFGSNLAGRHGAGAAQRAVERFGAVYGVGSGPTGKCYALPTKDGQLRTRSLHEIRDAVQYFLVHARLNPSTWFLVTKVGTGLAGYPIKVIGKLFTNETIPDNVCLPAEFWLTASSIPGPVSDDLTLPAT